MNESSIQIFDQNDIANIHRMNNANAAIDGCLDKYRHLVENVFALLKQYRGKATRYDKLKINYEIKLALGTCMIWLPI